MLYLDADRNSGNVTDFVKLIFRYNPGLPEYFSHLRKEIQTNSCT